MRDLIYGNELYEYVPEYNFDTEPRKPVVRLSHGLTLDDSNFFQYPTLVMGGVGSGKSTLMHEIIPTLIDNCDKSRDNMVIFCAKPDMLRYSREKDIILSIHSERPDCLWNIFEDMKASDDPYTTLREIATDLFAEQRKRTMQVFFPASAQDIFIASCRYMYDYGLEKRRFPSNGDLVEFLDTTPVIGHDGIPGWNDLAEKHPKYFSMVRDYIGKGDAQGRGVLSELRTMLSSTLYGSFAGFDGTFSAIKSLKTGGHRIFLHYDYANSGHSTLTVFKIILDLLIKQAMRTDAMGKTWFILDEASLLPHSETLTDALSFGRDPSGTNNGKNGIRLIMALQSARLLTNHYTKEEAESLLSLFVNVIAMRISDPMSRAVMSERFGKAHYQYTYAGIGDRVHYVDSVEDVVSDYHFSLIKRPGQAIISIPAYSDHPFIYDGFRG